MAPHMCLTGKGGFWLWRNAGRILPPAILISWMLDDPGRAPAVMWRFFTSFELAHSSKWVPASSVGDSVQLLLLVWFFQALAVSRLIRMLRYEVQNVLQYGAQRYTRLALPHRTELGLNIVVALFTAMVHLLPPLSCDSLHLIVLAKSSQRVMEDAIQFAIAVGPRAACTLRLQAAVPHGKGARFAQFMGVDVLFHIFWLYKLLQIAFQSKAWSVRLYLCLEVMESIVHSFNKLRWRAQQMKAQRKSKG